jgi:hypothetical protein
MSPPTPNQNTTNNNNTTPLPPQTACQTLQSTPAFSPYTPAAQGVIWFFTISIPVILFISLAAFKWYQKRFVVLRKRSFLLASIATFGSLLNWSCVFLRDAIGPDKFNCILFAILNYLVVPVLVTPLLLRLARFSNEQQIARLRRASIATTSSTTSSSSFTKDNNNNNLFQFVIPNKVTFQSFKAYVKGGTALSKRRNTVAPIQEKERQLEALAFATSSWYVPLWLSVAILPYFLGFIIKLPLTPAWAENCDGCDLDVADICFFLGAVTGLVCTGVYLITPLLKAPDALYLVPEFAISWTLGGTCAMLGLFTHLFDPGDAFKHREMNWRWIIAIASFLFGWGQSGLVVIIALRTKRAVLRKDSIVPREKLDDVLADPVRKNKLYDHLTRELSHESILFMDAVTKYKRLYEKEGKNSRAREVYDTFIRPRSHLEINISHATRDKVIDEVERGRDIGKNVFDDAYEEVKYMLLTDSFARFLDVEEKEQQQLTVGASSPTSMMSGIHSKTSKIEDGENNET